MHPTKTAATNGGRDVRISNWRPHSKNSLVGFFTAVLPSGMIVHNLMLHESNGARWIGVPAREWTDQGGAKQYTRFIEFVDRATADPFRDQILDGLDRHLAAERRP